MGTPTKGATKNLSKNRNKPACKRYTNEQRWLKNAARRQRRHFEAHPNDRTVVGTVPSY